MSDALNTPDANSAGPSSLPAVRHAVAHPNIALVKYWGKADPDANVPAVPSISITLDALSTRTRVQFDPELDCDRVSLDDVPLPQDADEAVRISQCLDQLRRIAGRNLRARVDSVNDFPTGAGLASSASGFAALVVAAAAALELDMTPAAASRIARAASASAARSLFGGFAELPAGRIGEDVAAAAVADREHWPLEVAVAICSEGPKPTGSTRGMLDSARSSPFYAAWVDGAAADADVLREAIRARDFTTLASQSEASCMKMHAVMLSTRPALIYWNAATLSTLARIRELQAEGLPVFFTIDAGPQVKAVCAPGFGRRIAAELEQVAGVTRIIYSGLGAPARLVGAP